MISQQQIKKPNQPNYIKGGYLGHNYVILLIKKKKFVL